MRQRKSRQQLAESTLTILLMLCASIAANGDAPSTPPNVSASNAWIRWLPSGLPAAAYVTLRNAEQHPVTLLGVSTRDYGAAMFHASRNQNGVETMLPIDRIRIDPHSQVSFAPAGLHIMLMQPSRAVGPGDHVILTLKFADGRSLPVQFEVRKPDGGPIEHAPAP